jgi:DhnA family fructose-bisphosphate aldolase class Ia
MGDLGLLEMIHQAIGAGAAGVCMGRQIFTHPNPEKITRAIVQIVHEGATADEAFATL